MLRVDVDPFHEIARNGHHMGLHPADRLGLQNAVGRKDEHCVLPDRKLLKVDQSRGFAFGPHADDEGVDAARKPEGLHG